MRRVIVASNPKAQVSLSRRSLCTIKEVSAYGNPPSHQRWVRFIAKGSVASTDLSL